MRNERWIALLATLLVPARALGCPACASNPVDPPAVTLAIGLFVLIPLSLVAATLVLLLKLATREKGNNASGFELAVGIRKRIPLLMDSSDRFRGWDYTSYPHADRAGRHCHCPYDRRVGLVGRRGHPGRLAWVRGRRGSRRKRDHGGDRPGTRGIRKVAPLAPDLVRAQLEAVLQDLSPKACKTGALGNAAIVEIVADVMRSQPQIPLVVDPVVNPTRGRALLDDSGFAALVRELIPLATLIIPNKEETTKLAGRTRGIEDARRACKAIVDMGAKTVLVKGGHFTGHDAIDLFYDGKEYLELRSPRLEVPPMHGLGCSLSALITGYLALGHPLREAVREGHDALQRSLRQPSRVGDGLAILSSLSAAVEVKA